MYNICNIIDNDFCFSNSTLTLLLLLTHTIENRLGTKGHGLYLLVFGVLIGACCLCHGPALNNGLSKDPI